MKHQLAPRLFFGFYLILFAVCAISPYDRPVWWVENLPIVGLMILVAWIHRRLPFSTTSLVMMSFLVTLHTVGGHFSFSRVPFEWVTDLFGFERNHFDRIAHFTVGFFAYPIAEILARKRLVNSRWLLYLFPIFAIVTLAAMYELFEWAYALSADAEAGIAVLGAQGDIWDAQQDMLADTLGALMAMALFAWSSRRRYGVAAPAEETPASGITR